MLRKCWIVIVLPTLCIPAVADEKVDFTRPSPKFMGELLQIEQTYRDEMRRAVTQAASFLIYRIAGKPLDALDPFKESPKGAFFESHTYQEGRYYTISKAIPGIGNRKVIAEWAQILFPNGYYTPVSYMSEPQFGVQFLDVKGRVIYSTIINIDFDDNIATMELKYPRYVDFVSLDADSVKNLIKAAGFSLEKVKADKKIEK